MSHIILELPTSSHSSPNSSSINGIFVGEALCFTNNYHKWVSEAYPVMAGQLDQYLVFGIKSGGKQDFQRGKSVLVVHALCRSLQSPPQKCKGCSQELHWRLSTVECAVLHHFPRTSRQTVESLCSMGNSPILTAVMEK